MQRCAESAQVPGVLPVPMHVHRDLHRRNRSRRVGGGVHTWPVKITSAVPEPDGFDTAVTFDSPTVAVSRGPVDRIMTLLGRVRHLPLGMPLRIATAGGPPIAVQGLEIREIEHSGATTWAVVLVPEGVEPRRVLRDELEED